MEGLILLCIGFIAVLFYRTSTQKKQLSSLQQQFKALQQELTDGQELTPSSKIESDVSSWRDDQTSVDDESIPDEKSSYARNRPKVSPWKAVPKKTSGSSSSPTVIDQALSRYMGLIKNYFSQGNQIVRIGIIVLFFGMSFLAKYSIDNSLVSIEVRMIGIISFALIMLAIGWLLRIKNPAYGLIMQGGGIAISYIAIFASFKIYQLIPSELTFPLLIVFSLLAMSLAVYQNSRALAITAITGGFAAPILASTGGGSHVSLLSYYLGLNCAIFFVAWFKSWRLLNAIGFLFTFVMASLWGVTQYRPEHFSSTEPFLIAFFLIYVAISILFSIKQKPELKGYVDGSLVFGVPMVGFGLQAALVNHMEYGLAISSSVLAGFYFLLTFILKKQVSSEKQGGDNLALMSQAMLALGVIFATLAIPFALDGRWSAASWAIEGAGFVWIALRQQREILKYIGFMIQIAGALFFFADYPYQSGEIAFVNVEFMGIATITLAALFTCYFILTQKSEINTNETDIEDEESLVTSMEHIDVLIAKCLMMWGLIWWYIGGLFQVDDHIQSQYEITSLVAFITVSAGLWLVLTLKLRWQAFRFFPWLLILPLCLIYWPTVFDGHFAANYGFISWPLGLGLLYGIFYKFEQKGMLLVWPNALHCMSYILVLCVVSYELAWIINDLGLASAWRASLVMLILLSALHLINLSQGWPFKSYPKAYQTMSAIIIISLMFVWSLFSNFLSVLEPDPISYLPVLNPVDLIQLVALFTIIKWYRLYGHKLALFANAHSHRALGLLASFIFVWINIVLFKTIHIVAGVDYQTKALFESALVQTCVSIMWTLIGLVMMMLASKKSLRFIWVIGACLTAIVVAKLFLLDLSGQGTVERIISFLVVGILLLVVGYFSPVPPAIKDSESKAALDSESLSKP